METFLPLNSPCNHIEPLLGIAHIASWIVLSLGCVRDDSASIDISITTYFLFCDDIDNFFSGEFFVLGRFGHECLVCRSAYEICE
jgi:hypothetical protein